MDQWRWRPVAVTLPLLAVLKLLMQLPGGLNFFIVPLSLLAIAAMLGVLLWATAAGALRARWRQAVSFLTAFLLVLGLWSPIDRVDDRVHLWLTVTFGLGQLGPTQDVNGTRVHDWSTGLAGGPNTFLIEDPSDRVAGPPLPQSAGDETVAQACTGKVTPIGTHLYICTL